MSGVRMRSNRGIPAVLLGVALAAGGTAAAQAPAVASPPEAAAGRVVEHTVAAPSLAGNLVGDAAEKRALVYLPPGYDAEPARRYPVIYLLHGIFDRPEVWVGHFGLPAILDDLVAAGEMPPAIVVMPDGGNRYGGGFYRNSPVSGNWADFIASELVAFTDATYRTVARREGRAVVGHSMGGYGAIHLAMERPEVFAVVYAMSPCCLAPVDDAGQGNPVWQRLIAVGGPQEIAEAVERRDFYLVALMGLLSAFAPAPDRPPLFIELPFGVERGETVIREEVYPRFSERFPLFEVHAHRAALASLAGLAIDYGNGDQFAHIPTGSRDLSARLAELRIPHRFEVYAGDHRQQLAARLREIVLPWVAARLAAPDGS